MQQQGGVIGHETIVPPTAAPRQGSVQGLQGLSDLGGMPVQRQLNGPGFTGVSGIRSFPVGSLVSMGNIGPGPIAYGCPGVSPPPRYLPGEAGLGLRGMPPGYMSFVQQGGGRGLGMQVL
jgi:hypothetical protein